MRHAGSSPRQAFGDECVYCRIEVANNDESIAVDPSNPDHVYVTIQHSDPGIVRASFDGQEWAFTSLTDGIAFPGNGTVVFDAAGDLYLAINGAVFVRDPENAEWDSLNHPASAHTIAAAPELPGVLFTGGPDGIHRRAANGTWTLEVGPEFGNVRVFAFSATPLAVVEGFGVLRRDTEAASTGSWAPSTAGLNAANVKSLLVDPRTPGRYLAGVNGPALIESLDGGSTWHSVATGIEPGTAVDNLSVSPFHVNRFHASQGHDPYMSVNAGGNWLNLDPDAVNTQTIEDLVLPDADTVVVAAGSRVYRVDVSDVGNIVWTVESDGLPASNIKRLVHDGQTGDLYALTFSDGVYRGIEEAGVFTWTEVPIDHAGTVFSKDMTIDEDARFVHFSSTGRQIYRLDLSAPDPVFSPLSHDLPNDVSRMSLFRPSGSTRLVAVGGKGGAFFSENGGLEWQPLAAPLEFGVNALVEDVHANDQYLAATRGASVMRLMKLRIFQDAFE